MKENKYKPDLNFCVLNQLAKGGRFQLTLEDGTLHECHLGFIQVVDDGGLRGDVGEQVKEKLLNT